MSRYSGVKSDNSKSSPTYDDMITINGKKYRQVNMTKTSYVVSAHKHQRLGSLLDRGANGGVAGDRHPRHQQDRPKR